jgi:hypothetical protein
MNNNYILLDRIGYGSNFNNIYVNIKENKILKECKSEYGLKKIIHEINFYKFIISNNINFPVPKIYSFNDKGYIMEYLSGYISLYKLYNSFSEFKKQNILTRIKDNLDNLHQFDKKIISKEEYFNYLNIEIKQKINERYMSIKHIIDKYSFIKKINNTIIIDFSDLHELITNKIYEIVNKKTEFYLVPIHGDCQFNNILYNDKTDDIIFIDPRGYYGTSEIYGIPEYDLTKIYFALSGYDEFDNRTINNLDIKDDNINIIVNTLDNTIYNQNNIEILLMIITWLGNAHCFINNEYKLMYSYYISLFIGSTVKCLI